VGARDLLALRKAVECQSLSPYTARRAYKSRLRSAPCNWRRRLLDLTTLAEAPLGETRSVDDQVEWLDDGHVLYALPDEGPPATIATNLWLLAVDGDAPPRLFLRQALSPPVSRVPPAVPGRPAPAPRSPRRPPLPPGR